MPMKEGEVSASGNSLISIGKQLAKLFQLTTKTRANYEIVVDVQHQSFFNSEIFNLPNNLRPNWIGTVRDPIGGFQLLDLIIMELKSQITCYNSMPLIG